MYGVTDGLLYQSLTDLLSKKYRYHLKYSRALEIVSNHWDEL